MARRHDRSLRGNHLDGPIPHEQWKSTTFVGGLTERGFVFPCILDAPMNGSIFMASTEQMLATESRPGDIVIMDNLQCLTAASALSTEDGAIAGDGV